ncbi:MAG: glycoside hydrolase family 38 C-terminal domain-containing protein [Bacteroidota bacterium]
MKARKSVLLVIFLSFYWGAFSQEYLNGYKEEVSGKRFSYHSPLPDVKLSLLSRARSDYAPIEWKTETVPENYKGKTVSFIWLYGTDVLAESQGFEMYINNEKYFHFSNPVDNKEEKRSFKNKNGAELSFIRTMIDKHGDQMGFAVLKIPRKNIMPGEQVNIKIDGTDRESNAWVMTFKAELKEKLDIIQTKTVSKKDGKFFHTARFCFIHLGDTEDALISVGKIQKRTELKTGYNSVDILIPKVNKPTQFTAQIKIGNKKQENRKFTLKPVKEWTIYMVQHTHTDIGYTRPQTEILAEHLRYIDDALDYCDQTDDYPENSKFRWTCETAWSVREYLKSRPETQIERLLKRIKEGRIEVTGMFFNFSEVIDETTLAMQTKTLKAFKDRGINVQTAMQNDVNGIGWCMVDFYKNTGVKYLTMGQHGHRAQIPFSYPTPFWWESQSGNRLLAYRSEHYQHANGLGLTSGQMDILMTNLSKYLTRLDEKGYPYNRTSMQFSGYVTDNSPPSTKACDIVKEWNEKYEWPKLKISLANEFMVWLDENKANSLQKEKVAWPDWWADGFGSAMNETKAARTTNADMIANMGLLSMAKIMGAELPKDINQDITRCYDHLLFWDEHTFGAAESISDPMAENCVIQWGEKAAHAWSAVVDASMIREKAMGFIQPYINKSNVPVIAVFNTLNWNRSAMLKVYIDHDMLPTNKKAKIIDKVGNIIPAQLLNSREDGSYWALWVPDVPAMGYKTLEIHVSNESQNITVNKLAKKALENKFYKLNIDTEKGVITSLFDKELQIELLDKSSKIKLGEFIYEQLESRHSMERLTNSNRDTVYVPLNKKLTRLSNIQINEIETTSLWNSIKIHGDIPICTDDRGVNIEIRLYHNNKRIELLYDMHKLPVTNPEGVYVAFPFKMEGENQLTFDVQGGIVYPGVNQLEGTSSDWNVIQNFASVTNSEAQIVFCSGDIPLVQFGDINTGRFYYKHQPKKSHIYSWVLNNYWTTNFKASQEGEMKWRYHITSSSDKTKSFATRFGIGSRVPLLARVLPSGKSKSEAVSKSILDISLPNLLLVNAKPSEKGDGVILQVRETEGDHAILDITKMLQQTGASSIFEVNILEDEIKRLNGPLLIEHYETKFIKIVK